MAQPSSTPQATVRKSRRLHLSFVWLVPLVAALVGGFLFYRTEIDVGPTIRIAFADGTSITRGSKLVYRGVEVGTVQSVELDSGLQHVNVVAELHKAAAGLAREGSQFWIVEPRVSVGQVTGLSTLLSGSYIEVAPGDGPATTRFAGLPGPPVVSPGEPDLTIFLETDDAASLQVGSPILYRGIGIGKVAAVNLPQDGTRVQLEAAIAAEHAPLVRTNSIFWRTSGVHFDLQPLDPKIDISSVASLIRGGVAFATPGEPGAQVEANAVFELLDQPPDRSVVEPKPGLNVVLTAARLGSVAVGDPVYYREVQVGEVRATGLEDDSGAAEVHALIWQRYAPLVQEGTMFWNASGLQVHAGLFSGATIDLESLASLLAGGVAFATPDQEGTPAKDGSRFVLHDKPEDDWLQWRPIEKLAAAVTPIEHTEGFSVQDMAPATYTVTTASHVRAGPDTTYPVLTTLRKNTTVSVTGKVENADWYRVQLGDAPGYVWAKLLEPAQAAATQ
jgi:paraquat-inducible protein B